MNGSENAFTVRPEDLSFRREDGSVVYGVPAREVVDHLLEHAGHDDVIKLIATYEMSLSGVTRFRSTNGYEARRENALAEIGSAKLKAPPPPPQLRLSRSSSRRENPRMARCSL